LRQRYDELIARPDYIEDVLRAGALKARAIATPFMEQLRQAVGLRSGDQSASHKASSAKRKGARVVQFKDDDGQFRFRLLAASGQTLLVSLAQPDPKQVGLLIGRIKARDATLVIRDQQPGGYALCMDDQIVALGQDEVPADELATRRQMLAQALEELGD